MIITYWHVRTIPLRGRSGMCIPGAKRVCERYGWDWDDFIKNGISEETLLSVDNALCTKLVEYAHSLEQRKND